MLCYKNAKRNLFEIHIIHSFLILFPLTMFVVYCYRHNRLDDCIVFDVIIIAIAIAIVTTTNTTVTMLIIVTIVMFVRARCFVVVVVC